MAASAARWTCARCAVSFGRIDGALTNRPVGWTESEEEIFCLGCSRAMAGDAALDAAPSSTTHEERARIRRRALVEFEIERAPNTTDRAIAQACRTSKAAVAAIRKSNEEVEPQQWR
jgi:hypothetical protein